MATWRNTFTEVVATRGDALLRYAYLLCGDRAETADLVQDALLATFQRARLGTDVRQIEAYARRAVLNAYLDKERRRRRFRSIRHLIATRDSHPSFDEGVANNDSAQRILNGLSPRQRACVVMRFYEDLTVADIAARIGCSDGSVKRHLNAAIDRMATSQDPAEKRIRK